MFEIELWQIILAFLGVIITGLLTGAPGILALRRQAKKDELDAATKRTETVLVADEAAWKRTHDTIDDLTERVKELEKERAEWRRREMTLEGKIERLEDENRKLKLRIDELEGKS